MVTTTYASVDELRDQIGDDTSNVNADLLTRALNAASRAIDRHCGRTFYADDSATPRLYRPGDGQLAAVDDISTTTGLVVATDGSGDGTYSTVWDPADYQLEPLNADSASAFAWWWITAVGSKTFPTLPRRASLQVTARWGWSAVPDDVTLACVIKAVGLFKRRESPLGVAGFGEFGAVRISRRDPDVMELLGPYVRMTSLS